MLWDVGVSFFIKFFVEPSLYVDESWIEVVEAFLVALFLGFSDFELVIFEADSVAEDG